MSARVAHGGVGKSLGLSFGSNRCGSPLTQISYAVVSRPTGVTCATRSSKWQPQSHVSQRFNHRINGRARSERSDSPPKILVGR
jgi:hypothetical protein